MLAALALPLLAPDQATAAPGITVSKATGLNPAGDTITMRGSGFDPSKGIYVAICVDNGPGQVPTPCLGGMDTSGSGGGSAWISSNPPSYGVGLATPYGPGGSFAVTLSVVARDPVTGTDCRKVVCAAVTRADHTRTSDRSQDTRVRLTFAAPAPAQPKPRPPAAPRTTQAPPVTTKTTTTTTTNKTTATKPTTTAPPASQTTTNVTAAVGETAGTPSASGTGWWLGAAAAALAAAGVLATVVLLRRRARSPNLPAD